MIESISAFVARSRREFLADREALSARIRVAVGVVEPFASVNRLPELVKRDALAILSTGQYSLALVDDANGDDATTDDIF